MRVSYAEAMVKYDSLSTQLVPGRQSCEATADGHEGTLINGIPSPAVLNSYSLRSMRSFAAISSCSLSSW
jgi:hypothetical protein